MQFNITFKTLFEYILKKVVLCIQIRFVSTEKTTRIASRASCLYSSLHNRVSISITCIYRVCQKKERHFKYICKVANNGYIFLKIRLLAHNYMCGQMPKYQVCILNIH